ncbi:helix-turn-helix domain-containing protein [Thermoactinospora rubra]|uniref:helix-turn-helix domain-containing protein n=1 Tax=Thermoactinospora rubra TaxID=1088767 RepID=UPI000A111693|nr:helix-turn-helix transcriptional regulator [Thermoactinospora rubra]
MDPHIAELLDIDLADPEVQRENAAIERDMLLIETLVEIRKRRRLTQAEVAERMGRSQPAVSDFERLGGDPHLSTIRRYALAVGADVYHYVVAHGEAARTSSTPAKINLRDPGVISQPTPTSTFGTINFERKLAAL